MLYDLKIAVVIPCYRVERSVAGVIARVPEFVDAIFAVNDASPDATREALEAIASPRLTIINHETNQGVGGAMVSGFIHALEAGMDLVVKLDGDGQMAPERMLDLIEPLADDVCDYAKGNRFLHFKELRSMPLARKAGNIALTVLTKIASGYWHTFDPQNGYVAIRSDYLRLLDFERLRTRRYFFENEMLIQLNVHLARVLDCPMPSIYQGETSSLRVSQILTYFPYLLVRGFLSRMFRRHVLRDFSVVVPLYLFGAVLFGWGCVFGFLKWLEYGRAHVPAPTGTIMLAVLPLILGAQMLMQGMLFEILETPRPDLSAARRRRRDSSRRQD